MEYKLYQTEWNGISLKTIAHELGVPKEEVASSDFYDAFYKKLDRNGYAFDEKWLKDKYKLARLLERVLKRIGLGKNTKIISLGCGTGVVEKGLIEEGYDIELQECQSRSLGYLYKNGIKPSKVWITNDLKGIPENSYDVVVMNLFLYVFDIEGGIQFIKNAKQLLNPNGRLVVIATAGHLEGMLGYWKSKLNKKRNVGVFWGYLRNLYLLRRMMRKAGLKIEGEFAIDRNMQAVNKRPKTTLGFPNEYICYWCWILRKR